MLHYMNSIKGYFQNIDIEKFSDKRMDVGHDKKILLKTKGQVSSYLMV